MSLGHRSGGFSAVALALVFLTACHDKDQRREAAAKRPSTSMAASSAAPTGPTAAIARCGWGSVTQGPGIDSPPWLIALVDVTSKEPLPGLAVVGAELSAEGKPITKIGGPPGIRVQQGSPVDSLAAVDTAELEGALAAGAHRLRVGTRLEGTLVDLQGKYPDKCRIVLTDEAGHTLSAEGKLDPVWEVPSDSKAR